MNKYMVVSLSIAMLVACSSKAGEPNQPPPSPGSSSSSGTTTNSPPPDPTSSSSGSPSSTSGSSSSGSSTSSSGAPPAPTNQATCIQACQTQYPKASAENDQLNTDCFLGNALGGVCNDLPGGGVQEYQPNVDPDGGFVCNTQAANSWPIQVPGSQACANALATSTVCCTDWIAIFASVDGQGLNNCSVACYNNFKN